MIYHALFYSELVILNSVAWLSGSFVDMAWYHCWSCFYPGAAWMGNTAVVPTQHSCGTNSTHVTNPQGRTHLCPNTSLIWEQSWLYQKRRWISPMRRKMRVDWIWTILSMSRYYEVFIDCVVNPSGLCIDSLSSTNVSCSPWLVWLPCSC